MSEHVDTELIMDRIKFSLMRTANALLAAGPDSRHFERLCEERNALIRELKESWKMPVVDIAKLANLPWGSIYDILDGRGDPR